MLLITARKVSSLPRCRNEQGMTLIELLIALSIMAITAVALLAGLSTSFRGIMVSERSVTMDGLAKNEMEYIKSTEYTIAPWNYQLPGSPPIWDPEHIIPGDYAGYTIEVNADLITGHNPDDGIQQVTVIVSHVDTAGEETSLIVSGYKARRQ